MYRQLPPTSRLIALLAFGAGLLMAIGVVVWLAVESEYKHRVDLVLRDSSRTAQKLAIRTQETLDRVNQTTLLVKYLVESGRLHALSEMRDNGILANDITRVVLVTNGQGFIADTTSDAVALNLADEDDFKAHKRYSEHDLIVGLTQPSPLAGGFAIPLSRRINAPDGDFAGIVLATVDPQMLTGEYSKSESPDTAVGVLGLDGRYRSRTVDGHFSFGESIDVESVEQRAREVQATRRPVRSPIDGVDRFVTAVRVDRYPMVAVVAQDADTALASYRQMRDTIVAWAGAVVVLLVLGGAKILEKEHDLEVRDFELGQARYRLQDLYDHAPCGYFSLDATGVFVRANATAIAWLGCSHDAVIDKRRPTDFLDDEGRAVFEQNFPVLLTQGRMGPLEFELSSRTGSVRRVSMVATAIRDDEGRFVHSRSVMYDITELDRMRRQLAQVNREQTAMLDSDLVGITRLKNRVVVWKNRALERMFGYSEGELEGQPLRMLYLDEPSYQELGQAAYPVLAEGKHYRTQLRMRRKDGSPIWIDMSAVLLSAETGESMWMMLDITSMKLHQERAERAALHDGLTGLPNRVLLMDRLSQALASAQRDDTRVAVCFIDLDGFKTVNDRLGHAAGDRLLQVIGRRLEACVRANDTVARLGGDEFVLVLTQLHVDNQHAPVLERVRQMVAEPVELLEGQIGRVTASIGVATCPDHACEAGRLLSIADEAMYADKASGRAARISSSKEVLATT